MNDMAHPDRNAIRAAMLELLWLRDPYIDWKDAQGHILGAVYIDEEFPEEVTAAKRMQSMDVVRRFSSYEDAMKWAMDKGMQ